MSTIRFQLHSIQFKKENGFETYFPYHTIFSLIIGFHLGRHLGYIEMLNDARVASLGFFKNNVCTTRINKEKNFKIKFQVLLVFAKNLPDYQVMFGVVNSFLASGDLSSADNLCKQFGPRSGPTFCRS